MGKKEREKTSSLLATSESRRKTKVASLLKDPAIKGAVHRVARSGEVVAKRSDGAPSRGRSWKVA
jgi:hypothetical protein